MNKTSAATLGAALCISSLVGFTAAVPASAATVAEWGVWLSDEGGDVLAFSNASMSDATYTVANYDGWDIYSPDSEGEGFSANSPLGELIGANAASTQNLFLKVETEADNSLAAVVTIDFESPVPAGQLVLALSDVDSDNGVISMEDGNGDPLTGPEIVGTATTTSFNFEDLSSADKPQLEAAGNTVTIGSAPDGTDGSTGWVRPSVDVSSITISISTEDGNNSSQRIWVGQIGESPSENLAKTGSPGEVGPMALFAALFTAVAAVALRRRSARA